MQGIINDFSALFPYTPTACQDKGIKETTAFLTDRDTKKLLLLLGYAGTGKTTFISVLVNLFKQRNKRCVLLAPTGRAAKVMASYTQRKAFTIHKRIYSLSHSEESFFSLNIQPNFHKNTFFIVDEASMISDIPTGTANNKRSLLADLVYYVRSGENCYLILVGDKAQLPPVGTNKSPALNKSELESRYDFNVRQINFHTVVRQKETSGILINATALRHKLEEANPAPPFFTLDNFNDFLKISGVDLRDTLDSNYSYNTLHDVIILCRSNKRANLYNKQIRHAILFREDVISAGDIMMVVKNNYFWLPEEHSAGFIANGDTIEIMRINSFYELYAFNYADVTVRLTDYSDDISFETTLLLNTIEAEGPALSMADSRKLFDEVSKDFEDLASPQKKFEQLRQSPHLNALQVKFAYAITTHKAQGGQWEKVFIDYGFLNKELLDKSFLRWLYTALTRAVKKVYLINFDESFFK